ncbi:helix-turn-helix transcriptional regulator [Dehalogenimonas etheniformans]|uniref:Uncharacterized protein n=1 Tax=Dehalogenimonas etheniformans TaxID=1536648 RepID=A0A2P5P8D1_9CHLR|nr:hypothetical protein [Dehalogenimonas etheniformans]PPD58557.1 hypothetical protein JP09_001335 [Dehalogenimonas etheniformans]QNT76678.1 hypothetical protein HX448_08280 [Dehalogenimonas etheniformans]
MGLAGLSEVAEMANVTKQVVINWRTRFEDFPSPVVELAAGPVWLREDINDWLKNRKENLAKPTNDQIDRLKGSGDILGVIYLLSLATDSAGFKDWLVKQLGIEVNPHVFNGYMFALSTLIRLLHMALDLDFSLDLTEDFTFSRARFYGAPIAEVPNSCEKAILLRNVNQAARKLLNTKSWAQIEQQAKEFDKMVTVPFQRISTVTTLRLPKVTPDYETAVNFIGQWHMHLFLHDTRRGYPHGYLQPMLNERLEKERLDEAFDGYKLTVQYLWFRLLGNEFHRSIAANIHKATNWREFDQYYRPIQHELIDPKEKVTHLFGGFNTLIGANNGAKQKISELLQPQAKEQPLPLGKDLQRRFLWYDIELIDASSTVFNGVMAFISILNGLVVLRTRSNNPEHILVMRVKHPAGGTINGRPKFDYSYGILIEGYGNLGISDYSGWLLFFDCCGDYSGFAGSQHAMAEQEIQLHLKQKSIEMHEVTVEKDKFIKSMQGKLLSTTKDVMHEAVQTKSDLLLEGNRLGAARGVLLELLGMRHYYKNHSGTLRIEWSFERIGQEIDLLIGSADQLTFVECKKPGISNPISQVNKLKDKVKTLLSSEEFIKEWQVTSGVRSALAFAVWDRPALNVFNTLKKTGVDVLILSSEAEKAGIGQKAREHLKLALDADKSKPKLIRDEFFKL